MRNLIKNLNENINDCEVVACCCGHGIYPMTIVVEEFSDEPVYREWCSNIIIPRTTRFYKKDKKGYFYIPEVIR
jgi:hypothetical protein